MQCYDVKMRCESVCRGRPMGFVANTGMTGSSGRSADITDVASAAQRSSSIEITRLLTDF